MTSARPSVGTVTSRSDVIANPLWGAPADPRRIARAWHAAPRWACSWCRRSSFGLLILRHARRKLLWLRVTWHPSAEWIARQLTEACGWNEPPRHIIRDREGAYGGAFIRRIAAMGIRDRPISARSPWQNGCAERLIGSIRWECLDHVVVFGERHLRHLLNSYQKYYNEVRTCRCRRTRRFRVTFVGPAACLLYQFWRPTSSVCFESEFPTRTAMPLAILYGAGNGLLTIARGTVPLAIFGRSRRTLL